MAETIRHIGTVENISGNMVKVRILQSAACTGCHAAKLCKSSESKEKIIEVHHDKAGSLQPGDVVTIVGTLTQGLKATWWAYILPLILVVAVLAASFILSHNDALSALVALGVLCLYYIIMYSQRKRFERSFQMKIE